MKHFVRRLQALAASLVVVAAGLQAQKAPRDMDRFIDQLMKKMTLEEKIGQLNLPVTGEITTGQAKSSDVAKRIRNGEGLAKDTKTPRMVPKKTTQTGIIIVTKTP